MSLQSAAAVLQNMDSSKYEAVMVSISKMGDWYSYTGPIENIKNDTWFDPEICTPAVVLPNRSESALLVFGQGAMQKIRLDAAFPVLHGQNGEDGTVQGLLNWRAFLLWGAAYWRLLCAWTKTALTSWCRLLGWQYHILLFWSAG